MFYILNKAGTIVRSATSVRDRETLRAAGYTVIESEVNLPIDEVEVHKSPARRIIAKKEAALPRIVLSTTARDTDGDGIPEIPANGKSKTSLRVSLEDTKGATLEGSVEVTFRVTAGAISHRTVVTEKGEATIEFTSGMETVTALVCAFSEGFTPGCLEFEFVPPGK